ncbi:MAG: flavin reductase [Hyphomicrobium sp.]
MGTCSGADTDKFAKFQLTPRRAKLVGAPLIEECLANIECKVVDMIPRHNIVVLEGVAARIDQRERRRRMIHAVGDGTFIVDGAGSTAGSRWPRSSPGGSSAPNAAARGRWPSCPRPRAPGCGSGTETCRRSADW